MKKLFLLFVLLSSVTSLFANEALDTLIDTFGVDNSYVKKSIAGSSSYVSVGDRRECIDVSVKLHFTGDPKYSDNYESISLFCIDRQGPKEYKGHSFTGSIDIKEDLESGNREFEIVHYSILWDEKPIFGTLVGDPVVNGIVKETISFVLDSSDRLISFRGESFKAKFRFKKVKWKRLESVKCSVDDVDQKGFCSVKR